MVNFQGLTFVSVHKNQITEMAAFAVYIQLNERNWFSYLDVARFDSVILVESETLNFADGNGIGQFMQYTDMWVLLIYRKYTFVKF